jgi:chromate transporter
MIYLQLFLSFLQIGAFSFGGGYAAMPLIQNQVVDLHQWLTVSEFTDLVTLSQMTPGPIAVNSATFVGLKIAGVWGAIIATIGCILPSCIIVTTIAYFYLKYRHLDLLQDILRSLRPAVISLIFVAGLTIVIGAFFDSMYNIQIHMVFIFLISLYLLISKKINPILVMLLAGGMNVIIGMVL